MNDVACIYMQLQPINHQEACAVIHRGMCLATKLALPGKGCEGLVTGRWWWWGGGEMV